MEQIRPSQCHSIQPKIVHVCTNTRSGSFQRKHAQEKLVPLPTFEKRTRAKTFTRLESIARKRSYENRTVLHTGLCISISRFRICILRDTFREWPLQLWCPPIENQIERVKRQLNGGRWKNERKIGEWGCLIWVVTRWISGAEGTEWRCTGGACVRASRGSASRRVGAYSRVAKSVS